jgi:hypothetical protein
MRVARRHPGLLLSGVLYACVVGSMFTGVEDVFTPVVGPDRTWLIFVVFVAAHLALGASWRSAWVYALPPLVGVGGFVAGAAVHNPWIELAVFMGTPTAMLLVATGQILALGAHRIGDGRLAPIIVPAFLFLASMAPVAEAARETYNLDNAPRLDSALAQQLPLTVPALNSLCGDPLPASVHATFAATGQALVRATREEADLVVQANDQGIDENPGIHYELMTVRQLAQAQLAGLREFPHCDPGLEHALATAIG